MFKRLNTLWPATLVLGGCLVLLGCEQSGSNAADTTAKAASATSEVNAKKAESESPSTDKTDRAAPAALADDDHAGHDHGDHDHAGHDHAGHDHAGHDHGDHDTAQVRAMKDGQNPRGVQLDDSNKLTNPTDRGPKAQPDPNGELTVRAEPAELNIGEIATGDKGKKSVTLVNFGTEPVRLIECKSSCGCTAAKCPRGKEIAPGDSIDVEIEMTGGSRPQKITKMVRFMFEGQPQLPVTVTADSVSYVIAEPWTIDRDRSEDGKLEITSKDEKPFRIVKMHPPIIEEFSEEAQTEHVVNVDWDRWEELGSSRRLTFYTDHEKCDKIYVSVQAMYRPRDTQTANAQDQTPGERPNAMQIDGLTGPGAADAMEREKQRRFPNSPEVFIKNGQTEDLLAGIDAGEIDLESPNRTGATLLAVAAQHGEVGMVEGLLDRGADIEARDRIGKTPLMWAGHAKDVDVVNVLLDSGADIRARDRVVGTALSWTAMMGDGESVKALIEIGSDVNVSGTMGFTPLIWASLTGEPESIDALIEAGAEINVTDQAPSGYTPLMHAAQTGKSENVKVLIDRGADLEHKSVEEKTALLIAAENSGGNLETVKMLVEAGADLSATDLRSRNALDLAETRTDPRAQAVVAYLREVMGKTEPKADADAESDSSAQ